jgi:hypothetical protein
MRHPAVGTMNPTYAAVRKDLEHALTLQPVELLAAATRSQLLPSAITSVHTVNSWGCVRKSSAKVHQGTQGHRC